MVIGGAAVWMSEKQVWIFRLVNKTFFQVSGQDQDFCIQVSSKTKTFPS